MDTLAVLPTDNLLNYPSCALIHLLHLDPNIEIIHRDNALPSNIDSKLPGKKLFIGVGHGLPCIYTVQSLTPYIEEISNEKECNQNLRLDDFKNKAVYLISCYTGKHLGKTLVDRGARAFLGFNDEYLFFIGSPPCSEEANAVFQAEAEALKTLLSGGSIREANEARRRAYENISREWGFGSKAYSLNAPLISRLALYDESILVAYGDLDYRPVNHPEFIANLSKTQLNTNILLAIAGLFAVSKIQGK